MDVINESVLINRENVIEFLSKFLSDKPLEEKQKKEFLDKFDRLVNYVPKK